jgi:hypothetical protein
MFFRTSGWSPMAENETRAMMPKQKTNFIKRLI